MIRGFTLLAVVLASALLAYGQHAPPGKQTLVTFYWDQVSSRPRNSDLLFPKDKTTAQQLKLLPGPRTENYQLRVTNFSASKVETRLLTVALPPISKSDYAIVGRIRYEGVDGNAGVQSDAYLEMWSHFPDGSFYFSRTLADTGPMAKITGRSDWREFILPFHNDTNNPSPMKLEINLILPGSGAVYFEPIKLVQYGQTTNAAVPVMHSSWARVGILGFLVCIGLPILVLLIAFFVTLICGTKRAAMICLLAGGVFLSLFGLLMALVLPLIISLVILMVGVGVIIFAAIMLSRLREPRADSELRKIQAMDAG